MYIDGGYDFKIMINRNLMNDSKQHSNNNN